MMLSLQHINIKRESIPQTFISFNHKFDNIVINECDIIKNDKPSLVCLLDNKKYILKLVKPRRGAEIFKLLWGHSRLSKEINGNRLLAKLGINTPDILESAYAFIPSNQYQFLGYYIMKNLQQSGFDDAFDLMRFNKIDDIGRKNIIANLIADVKTMLEHRIIFTDLKLNNIFANKKGDICWIDTGVTRYKSLNKESFNKKFDTSIHRFLRIYASYLTESEEQAILCLLYKQ